MRPNIRKIKKYIPIEQIDIHVILVHCFQTHQVDQRFLYAADMQIALENCDSLFLLSHCLLPLTCLIGLMCTRAVQQLACLMEIFAFFVGQQLRCLLPFAAFLYLHTAVYLFLQLPCCHRFDVQQRVCASDGFQKSVHLHVIRDADARHAVFHGKNQRMQPHADHCFHVRQHRYGFTDFQLLRNQIIRTVELINDLLCRLTVIGIFNRHEHRNQTIGFVCIFQCLCDIFYRLIKALPLPQTEAEIFTVRRNAQIFEQLVSLLLIQLVNADGRVCRTQHFGLLDPHIPQFSA